MEKWVKPLSQVASKSAASRNLKDEEVIQALMAQAGVQDKVQKPTFLQRVSAGLGATEWTDDALKALQEGQSLPEAVGNYLVDIPRTLAGAVTGRADWVDAEEGKGAKLVEYLGADNNFARGALGFALDVLEPSLLVSSALKGGSALTKAGKTTLKGFAGKAGKEVVSEIGEKLGKEAGEIASKRILKGGLDATEVATDLIKKYGIDSGLAKTIEQGAYLGLSPESGIKIAGGKIPSYAAKLLENPLMGPFQVSGDILKGTKVAGVAEELAAPIRSKFRLGDYVKQDPEGAKLFEKYRAVTNASNFKGRNTQEILKRIFKNVPEEKLSELEDIGINEYVEIGGGLPQATTLGTFLKTLKDNDLISKGQLKRITGNFIDDELGLGLTEDSLNKSFSLINPNELEALGEAKPFFESRMSKMVEQSDRWKKFLEGINYQGPLIVRNAKDIDNLEKAITNSNLTQEMKDFYNIFLTNRFRENLLTDIPRKRLGLETLGLGYAKRGYTNFDEDKLLDSDITVNILDKRKRSFPSIADVKMYNDFAKTPLDMDKSMKTMIKNAGDMATQQSLSKGYDEFWRGTLELAKEEEIPFFKIKDAPSDWVETGIKPLDKVGLKVDPKAWKDFESVTKYIVGKKDVGKVMETMKEVNSLWKLMQTSAGVSVGNRFVPLNPSFYGQQFINNKISAMLYGGVNPLVYTKRFTDGLEVYKYIAGSKKANKAFKIGNFTVEQIANDFLKGGNMTDTFVDAATEGLDESTSMVGRVARSLGSGQQGLNWAGAIEAQDKLAIFIDKRLKGESIADASSAVRNALFDYSDLTQFEKESIRPWFAFYTWTRKNIEALFKTMGTDPKRMGVFDDFFSSLKDYGNDDEEIGAMLPDYLKQLYYFSLGTEDGKFSAVYGFRTPIESAADIIGKDYAETTQNILSSLAPLQRGALELGTGQSFFKGESIKDDYSAYTYRNLPALARNLMGIREETYTTSDGEEKTLYKMNPYVKYSIENLVGRPLTGVTKIANAINEKELFYITDLLTGVKYYKQDIDYIKKQYEEDRYKRNIEKLMDIGAVKKYENYYLPK